MPVCVVKDCQNSDEKGQDTNENVHYFCLPTNYSDRIKWQKFCGRKFKSFPDHAQFCSRHFAPDSIIKLTKDKWKLLRRSAPILNPPKSINVGILSKEVSVINVRNPHGKRKKIQEVKITNEDDKAEYINRVLHHSEHVTSSRSSYESQQGLLSNDKVLAIFKRHALTPWGWLENNDKFYFYKTDLPPSSSSHSNLDDDNVFPVMPALGECLVIDKESMKMKLMRRGDLIALHYLAPLDFDELNQTVIPKLANISSFIKRLKSRNDPVPTIAERLQFHAHSLQSLSKGQQDPALGSALNFMSNQLFNWILKAGNESHYHVKAPHFVPSAIRMALLVRNQSKSAYSVSFMLL